MKSAPSPDPESYLPLSNGLPTHTKTELPYFNSKSYFPPAEIAAARYCISVFPGKSYFERNLLPLKLLPPREHCIVLFSKVAFCGQSKTTWVVMCMRDTKYS